EGTCEHPLIADRYEFGYAGAVAGRENRNRVAIGRPEQVRVLFPRLFVAQTDAPLVTICKLTRVSLGHCDLSSDNGLRLFADRPRQEGGRRSEDRQRFLLTAAKSKPKHSHV